MRPRITVALLGATLAALPLLEACTGSDASGPAGGASGRGTGGAATGGTSVGSGGAGTGGTTAQGSGGQNGSGGAGSGGRGSGGAAAIPPTFETVKLVVGSNLGCLGADCHGGNEHNPLNLTIDGGLLQRLKTGVSKSCGNIAIVTPGKPQESALVKILKGPCGMTPRMPYECRDEDDTCTPPEYVAAIEQWVANGAAAQ